MFDVKKSSNVIKFEKKGKDIEKKETLNEAQKKAQ